MNKYNVRRAVKPRYGADPEIVYLVEDEKENVESEHSEKKLADQRARHLNKINKRIKFI